MGYIGRAQSRVDGRLKVTGAATYAAEFEIAKLAHGYFVTSDVARGRIFKIDSSDAQKAPGVIAIFTHVNVPEFVPRARQPNKHADGLILLHDDVIHYNEQPIALVIAETIEQAAFAASLVRMHITAEKATVDFDNKTPLSKPKSGHESKDYSYSRGNVSSALALAKHLVAETYSTALAHHNAMELHACIALWESRDRLTIFDSTQAVHDTRARIAGIFELPPENVRVISYFVVGGFGSKGEVWAHLPLAALAARAIGRPVKLSFTRRQIFSNTGFRSKTVQRVTLATDGSGKLIAQQHDTISQTSGIAEFVEDCGIATRMLYSCPNVATTHRLATLDMGTPTWMRAPGFTPGTYALESAMDELAYSLKIDPIELRLRNYAQLDEQLNKPWSSNSLEECYRVGRKKFGWNERNPRPSSMRDGNLLIGYGMATAVHPVYLNKASALARILADGTALIQTGTQDIGTGTYTVMTQIAADALSLPLDKVRFELGDSRLPESPASVGSTTAASVGSAVQAAALAVLRKLAQLAVADSSSAPHKLSPADVVAQEGSLAAKDDSTKRDSFVAILKRAGQGSIDASVEANPGRNISTSQYAFGAQFCEVRIDVDLCDVRVHRFLGVYASGRILNPKTARSQMIGGIIFGVGMALMEQSVADLRTGRFLNADLAGYHLPVNADISKIDVVFLEETDQAVNPIGVKGLGELGISGAAAAVANAVFHGTGKRVRDLPITGNKLL